MVTNSDYKEVTYWDNRFRDEDQFEWLAEFDKFGHYLLPYLDSAMKILHVGCGTSRLSFALYERGFRNITNVDYSATLVERMSEMHPEMAWICDDMRTLDKLDSEQFDIVIEKASIECILVDEQSQWQLSDKGCRELDDVFASVHRVLKSGGHFISVSFTQPHFRVPHLLRNPYWSCDVERFGDFFHYYIYRMKKDAIPNLLDLECYLSVTRQVGVDSDHRDVEEVLSPLEIFANSALDF